MFSFVLEERFGLNSRESFPVSFWNAVQDSAMELGINLENRVSQVPLVPLHVTPSTNGLDQFLTDVLDYLVVHYSEGPPMFWELTSLFFLHIMILPTLPVPGRTHQRVGLNEDLVAMLIGTFFPKINFIMASFVLKTNFFVDIDGRVFTTILRYTISYGELQPNILTELAGLEISSRLETVWRSANAPRPDFTKLLVSFPKNHDRETFSAVPNEEVTSFRLLPFHNQVFDDELATVRVTASDQDQVSSTAILEFSQSIPFSDTMHWHTHHRTILPGHLGGEGVKAGDKRLRQKYLRNNQRSMIRMQHLADTLTGASGKVLQQILIPPTGREAVRKPRRDKKVC